MPTWAVDNRSQPFGQVASQSPSRPPDISRPQSGRPASPVVVSPDSHPASPEISNIPITAPSFDDNHPTLTIALQSQKDAITASLPTNFQDLAKVPSGPSASFQGDAVLPSPFSNHNSAVHLTAQVDSNHNGPSHFHPFPTSQAGENIPLITPHHRSSPSSPSDSGNIARKLLNSLHTGTLNASNAASIKSSGATIEQYEALDQFGSSQMASSSKLFQAPTSLPQLDTAARPSVSSPAFPPNLTSHSQTNSGIPKRSMDLLFEQNTSNAVIDAPAMTGHAGQEQRQLGAGLDTISHDPISSSGVFASGPSLSAGLGDDAAIAPAFVERSLHQPSQRSDPLFTDGLPEVASALMWSLLPKGEQSQSTSKSSLLKYLPTVISQMQLDLQHHLELRSQGQPHGNVSKMSEDIIQTARWLAAKGKVVPVSQHQRPTLKVSLTSDQPSSSSRLQVSSQTRPGPPAPYAQPVIVQSTPVTQTPRPINALSVPTDHHARLIAPPVFDGESIERAWVTALDNVGSHMQSAWNITLQARDSYISGVLSHKRSVDLYLQKAAHSHARMKQETITLREELASKVRELQDAHGELSKIASNNERMKDAAQQYSERMIALRGTEVGKARMAAQQMYDERLRALRSEHEIAVLAQRDAHGDELKRFTSQAATEIESLRELLQKSTERVSDIQRDTVEIDQLKARCDEAMGNAEANAEQRWLSRYSDLQLKEAKLKEQLEAKGTELEAERERYKQLDVQATMRRGMVQSLKEQLEEGEAARTMSPSAAEYQQQRDELLQILRLQDDELRQLRLERQPQSTKPHEESEPSQAGSLDVVAESICNGSEMKYPLIAPLSRGGGLDRNDKAFVPAASPLPPSVVRQETRSQETLQPSLSTSQQIKTTDNTEPKSNPLRSDSNTAASQVAVPLINDHGKRRSSLFLLNDEDDTPVKKHFRVSESESSAPPSTQQHGADVPAHWVRDHFTRCVQKTADGRYICKICFVEDKKDLKSKGVPDSAIGEVKDRQPLPGQLSHAQVIRHIIRHQGVLRKLRDKVAREEAERKIKEEKEDNIGVSKS